MEEREEEREEERRGVERITKSRCSGLVVASTTFANLSRINILGTWWIYFTASAGDFSVLTRELGVLAFLALGTWHLALLMYISPFRLSIL